MKARRLPASVRPLPCVVLAIDPGKVSGWAIFVRGELLESGSSRKGHGYVVQRALQAASKAGVHLVVVGEKWQGGWRKDRSSARTVAGLGAQWGRWLGALEDAEPVDDTRLAAKRILRVGQSTWRARVIGGSVARKTEAWKAAAKAWVRARFSLEVSGDEAEAICIGVWASRAGEVAKVLPMRVLAAEASASPGGAS